MLIKRVGDPRFVDRPPLPQKSRDELGEHFAPISQMFKERKGEVYAVLSVHEPDQPNGRCLPIGK